MFFFVYCCFLFCICIVYYYSETTLFSGYSTEKIFNAFYSNAIPIYFGDYTITQYLNPKSFIHCDIPDRKIQEIRKFDKHEPQNTLEENIASVVMAEIQACIEEIRKVDEDDELYHQMLMEPVFINNSIDGTDMDSKLIGHKLRHAMHLEESYLIGEGQD